MSIAARETDKLSELFEKARDHYLAQGGVKDADSASSAALTQVAVVRPAAAWQTTCNNLKKIIFNSLANAAGHVTEF